MKLETIIGLEVHAQIKTRSKMFCSCAVVGLEAPPNSSICPICMGHPGTLPVLNRAAIELGLKAALALDCTIPKFSRFARKHYFYPDLPKGYQISMYEEPLAVEGELELGDHTIRIERLHLEEDAAKLIHGDHASLVDFNRAGAPLIEIVSRPDIRSPAEARAYLKEMQAILRAVGASDADMEKGQMRADANVSLRPVGEEKLGTKIEIKNLNSMRAVEHALKHEVERQSRLWENGQSPNQLETRGWDDSAGKTVLQRTKETSSDYRYFPEPDLPPFNFGEKSPFDLELLRRSLGELPQAKRERFVREYAIAATDAMVLAADEKLGGWFEAVISELRGWVSANGGDTDGNEGKLAAGWVTSKLAGLASDRQLELGQVIKKISSENFGEFLGLIVVRRITTTAARELLVRLLETDENPTELLAREGLGTNQSGDEIERAVATALSVHADAVVAYKSGKRNALQVLIGAVMKATRGRVDPSEAREFLEQKLTEKIDQN